MAVRDETHEESQQDPDASDDAIEPEIVADVEVPDVDVLPAVPDGKALTTFDPFQAYMRDVQRYPRLTPEEEHGLAVRFVKTQDPETAARLVTANLRLVVKIAYDYRRAYRNLLDLVQEGNIGLMQAVKKYDPYKGVKLSSYAAWWIRAYMLRFILNNWRLVKIGTTQAQRKLFFNLQKEKAKLAAQGIDATPETLAKQLDVSEAEVVQMDRRLSSGEPSLDAPLRSHGGDEASELTKLDALASVATPADEQLASAEMQDRIREKIGTFALNLKGKDRLIFDQRLLAEDPKTLQELGENFGVSRERVRQLEKRLQDKLRDYLVQELGADFGPDVI